jgi:prophage DNA circulation protein
MSGTQDDTQTPSWLDQLQPASWRGVPFNVLTDDNPTGRSNAVHKYPFRDLPWAEDMNRAERRYQISGFLVGDDCYAQEDDLRAATETPGPGELIHPVFGSKTVSLLDFSTGHNFARGRTVSVNFTFIEGGSPIYPSTAISTQDQTRSAASAAQSAPSIDYAGDVTSAVPAGAPITLSNPPTAAAAATYGPIFQQ